MRSTMTSRTASERGAVLIHVAIALLGLIAFTTFVVDYGIMWVSRGQAQTSADAGALAGAVALAYEGSNDFAGAKEKARAVAMANQVFGDTPDVQLADITFPTCPPGTPNLPDTCIKVDVFRNQRTGGNPLPTFFGHIVGIGEQGVRATATARVIPGNSTDCLKPWAVIDRWDEYNPAAANPNYPNPDPDFNALSTFDRYSDGTGGPQAPPQEDDLYVPPSGTSTGTGFRLPQDQGRQFAVKTDTNTNSTVSPGWFRAIRIPRLDGQNGGDVYRENIQTCGGLPNSYASPDTVCPNNIGNDDMAFWAARGCYATEPGNKVGPTAQGIEALIARDPGASWSGGTGGTVVGSTYSPATSSPRVVPIGVIDINHFMSQDPSGANGVLKMVNIYGFFIEGMGEVYADGTMEVKNGGKAVIGRIMTIPSTGTGFATVPTAAAFLLKIILVR
jgi:Putative Flp pilus-assembly TadE/G-like